MRNRTRVKAVLAAAVVLALGAGGATLASADSASPKAVRGWGRYASTSNPQAQPDITTAQTIVLQEHDTKSVDIDLGRNGFGPGDEFLFEANLRDAGDANKVGTLHVACTVLFSVFTCPGTARLAGGDITFSGAVPQSNDFNLAVTGGTGQFQNVRGQLHVHSLSDSRDVLTFQLIP